MRSRRVGAGAALGLFLCLLLPAAEPATLRREGERVAQARGCAACHALPGEARGRKPGPALLSPAPPQAPSEVLRRLWNHIPRMRQQVLARGLRWPEIRVGEMAELLAFLGSRPGLERAPNLERGRALVLQKGCLKCHQLGGEGAGSAPDLARFRRLGDMAPLAAALWNKAPVMLDRVEASGIPYPIFREGEMADLLGFLGAFSDASR